MDAVSAAEPEVGEDVGADVEPGEVWAAGVGRRPEPRTMVPGTGWVVGRGFAADWEGALPVVGWFFEDKAGWEGWPEEAAGFSLDTALELPAPVTVELEGDPEVAPDVGRVPGGESKPDP